jgi:hypothetical protein
MNNGGGGLRILKTSWPEALCGARSSRDEAEREELLDPFFYRCQPKNGRRSTALRTTPPPH